jgi:hypothetical protein
MRHAKLTALLLVPLFGCYAQLEVPDVVMTHTLCSAADCVPGGGLPLSLIQVSGANTFSVDFGDQPLLQPSNDVGPTSLKTKMILNSGAFDMKTAGGSFNQVTTVQLLAVHPGVGTTGDPCATASNCTAVAAYTQSTDGTADQHLVLRGNGSDLIALIDQATHQLTLEIKASGNAPAPANWNADVSMDMSLTSRTNLP